jgi:hypothetical protein
MSMTMKHTTLYFSTKTAANEYIAAHKLKAVDARWVPKSGDAWVIREIEDEPKTNPFRVIKGGIE